MNTLQQAYVNGFVKRASQHGLNEMEAISLLKQANPGPQPAPNPPGPAANPPGFLVRNAQKAEDFYRNAKSRVQPGVGTGVMGGLAASPGLNAAAGNFLEGDITRGVADTAIGVGSGLGAALPKNKYIRGLSTLAGYLGPTIYDKIFPPKQEQAQGAAAQPPAQRKP